MKQKTGYIRGGLFLGALAGLAVVLLARLLDVQVVQGKRFVAMADDNRFFSLAVPANRGVFLDRYNEPLVWNTRSYQRKLQPHSLYSEVEPITESEGLQLMATSGGQVERKVNRWYRFGGAIAHALGYVGPVTAEDMSEDSTLLPTESIGKIGLEAKLNGVLRGKPGTEVWEVNARVSRQRKVSEKPAIDGTDVQTSLDPYVSEVAASALGSKKGSVLVADAATGKLLALVNSPSYDPNIFLSEPPESAEKKYKQQQIQALFSDPDKPFFDRAVAGSYPPGSVFKLVTALAGLETQAINSSTTVLDEGILRVGEYEYGNWYYRQYGRTEGEIGLVRAIARSNDIFFYKAAEFIGINQLASMASLFGLGRQTGIEVTPEASGLVPTPSWKEQVIGEPWYLGNTYHMGIGQGDLLVSPIQISQLVQTIANNGIQCKPSLLMDSLPDCRSLSLSEQNLAIVLQGMLEACSAGGTAFPFFERNTQLQTLDQGAVACKTGTAEFGPADSQGYRKTHGWWAGIVAPSLSFLDLASASSASDEQQLQDQQLLDEPQPESFAASSSAKLREEWIKSATKETFPEKLVIVVLVESDDEEPFREGSGDAAPIGKQIIDWIEGKTQG